MTNMENFKECKLNGLCGGCLHQGVPYEEQYRLKNQQVLDLFDRFHVDASVYQGMVPAETPYRYRNKMEYTSEMWKSADLWSWACIRRVASCPSLPAMNVSWYRKISIGFCRPP